MDDESTEELTVQCDNCTEDLTKDDAVEINGLPHCQSCADEYGVCDKCETSVLENDTVLVYGRDWRTYQNIELRVCDSCADNFAECDSCSERHENLYETLDGDEVCDGCRENLNYCEHCDGCYSDYSADDHTHGSCDCEVPHPTKFRVRHGDSHLESGKVVTIDLPGGAISEVGVNMIGNAIRNEARRQMDDVDPSFTRYSDEWYAARQVRAEVFDKWYSLSYNFEGKIGLEWQGARGNFTKRLSRLAHTDYGIKLPPTLLSEIGNIAREQSQGSSINLEINRLLNESAGYWYHEDSCWWQSYGDSRCALKNIGGFGMRTTSRDNQWANVNGRAWVIPLVLNNDRWSATAETENCDGYVIFNGYGDLSGYNPARVLALMTGLTYKKIDFECSPMYVNAGGYLVTTQENLETVKDRGIDLSVSAH